MSNPYINIHTHHLSKDNGVFLFNNRFGFDKDIYLEKYFSIGIHPWDADLQVSTLEFKKIIQHPNCLAIGECGLDKIINIDLELQKIVFISQLDLAVKFQKPVIIHCVKAFDELIEICTQYHSKIPLVIHGFNKSLQLAKQLTDKGFYISLNYSIFKKKDVDFNVLPLEKLFLETDNNESVLIEEVYKKAAACFQIQEDDLKEKIYTNFTVLFKTNGR
ncbi:MAG: TatD family hydrolase [Bacteroidetes bacterium]|nr:TatD family hydrolase [Bacteroidota bacterium]